MESSSNTAAVQAELRRLAADLQASQDAMMDQALEDLIARLVPATPVSAKQHKHMFESYTAEVHGGIGLLGNEKDYSRIVTFGSPGGRVKPNVALNAVIDSAERDFADSADLVLTRLVNRYR